MLLNTPKVRQLLKDFDFDTLFIDELGWDRHNIEIDVNVDGQSHHLVAVAQKRGMVAFQLPSASGSRILEYASRCKIEHQVARSVHEHLILFTDATRKTQTWQWVKREAGKPLARREHSYNKNQPGDALIQKLQAIAFTIEEEEGITLPTVTGRVRAGFDIEHITKQFYEQFKKEHTAFVKFITGISQQTDRERYASVMLNRLMFVYFIQRKGFLADDVNYLRARLIHCQYEHGHDKFYSFYRYFLLRLFHEGLGSLQRTSALEKLLGRIPYLNGGMFEEHTVEKLYNDIQIADQAFKLIFDYFDQYHWHLDERPLRADDEINPDVLGYIFEKYINQKQMGAYYTKEDITEYIGKNTILPFLFDAARSNCKVAFENPKGSTIWDLLKADPDRYIYKALRHGTTWNYVANHESKGEPLKKPLSLPAQIANGLDTSRPQLLERRKAWNKLAPAEYGLPTEIWREVVARRQRYDELRTKLRNGEVRNINELITLNLDIRQFAQDVIENCEGPDLLRAFWHAIESIAVLDPTVGSGAFIFSALNILEPLYEACLDRMAAFAGDLDRSGENYRSENFLDFRHVLDEVALHSNPKYFIYKRIILNNLYGVDIMEEAVEICKLRLFLKLAAQIEPDSLKQNLGIEPLPDIDFNIRCGNSLVGYATADEVRHCMTEFGGGQKRLGVEDELNSYAQFCEKVEIADLAFKRFRVMQTQRGLDAAQFVEAKKFLGERLRALENELNRYLAKDYGVDVGDKAAYIKWLASHQPFHWFVEFYRILASGGFDVIIGNPPYVELKNVTSYVVRGYSTADCGDLYNLCLERSVELAGANAALGFIVPLSAFSVGGFKSFQDFYYDNNEKLWVSHWSGDAHPAKLFEGVDKRLEIVLSRRKRKADCRIFTSKYLKWYSDERLELFNVRPFYLNLPTDGQVQFFNASMTKIQTDIEGQILKKLRAQPLSIEMLTGGTGRFRLYFTRKVSFFLQFLDFIPEVKDSEGRKTEPSELKVLSFTTLQDRDIALACLSSALFYWFNVVNSDCRNLNKREILCFRIPRLPERELNALAKTLSRLMASYSKHSTHRTVLYKGVGNVTVQYFNFRPSKPILDEIDSVLARHYGFTDEELDFIINYDIKYRLGRDFYKEQ